MPEFEFGDRPAANAFREEHEEHLCPDDDRRMRTVTLVGSAPDRVLDQAAIQSASSREDHSGAGQASLTDSEKNRIDFSKARASVPHARAVKGIAIDEGVDDWLAYYDPTLPVDGNREVMERAKRDERGARSDSEPTADERLAQLEGAHREACDHASGLCENGDPDACEFLKEDCGLDDDTVDRLLNMDPDAAEAEGGEITGKSADALGRSWSGYKGAIAELEQALDAVRSEWENAQQAADAINGIRGSHGQDPIHFERLEEFQADLLDVTRKAAADCHECHADHAEHPHAVTEGDREDVREFVEGGGASTPVGIGEETASGTEETA